MLFYFYKTTNLINNKCYYGVHSTNNVNDNYLGSGVLLKKAIKKYGKNNFKRKIIKFFDSAEAAFKYEECFINEKLLKNNNNYNIIPGGKGLKGGTKYAKQFSAKGRQIQKEKGLAFFDPKIRQMGTDYCRKHKIGLFNEKTKRKIIKKSHSDKAIKKMKKTIANKNNGAGYSKEFNSRYNKNVSIKEVLKLRELNLTIRKIATILNCSQKVIQNRLKWHQQNNV